jgi:hypothetical protein
MKPIPYYEGWNDALEAAAAKLWRPGSSQDQSETWKMLYDMRLSWPRIEADEKLEKLRSHTT